MLNRLKLISLATLVLVVAALPLSALAGYTRINQPNPADPMGVQIYRLDNGLTVYLTENHESPRFEAQIAVRAGSKNDPPETTGLAHYLEHLLFKGTTHLGTTGLRKGKTAPGPDRRAVRATFPRDRSGEAQGDL